MAFIAFLLMQFEHSSTQVHINNLYPKQHCSAKRLTEKLTSKFLSQKGLKWTRESPVPLGINQLISNELFSLPDMAQMTWKKLFSNIFFFLRSNEILQNLIPDQITHKSYLTP